MTVTVESSIVFGVKKNSIEGSDRSYDDSGDPDVESTDPFDDEVLQFFKNITKEELFDCLIPFEDVKLFSRIAGEKDVKEDKPIQLVSDDLILLRCCLYY